MAVCNFAQAWPRNPQVPSVWHDSSRDLWVKTPFANDNRETLTNGKTKGVKLNWNKADKHWELAKGRYEEIVAVLLHKWGRCWVIQNQNLQETCAYSCRTAKGPDCTCSCGGVYHGSESHERWYDIGETFSTRHTGTELSCRILTPNDLTAGAVAKIKKEPRVYAPNDPWP